MKTTYTLRALLALLLLLLAGAGTVALSSAGIDWDVISGGGGVGSAGGVEIGDTVGQPAIGLSRAGNVAIGSGYWYAAGVAAPTGTFTPTPTPSPTPTQPTGCVDDRFEDNDTCAAAAPVTPGTYPNLQVCSGDNDFFSVDLKAGDTLTVTISFSHPQGDLDMVLFDTDCSTELSRSNSTTDNEEVTGTAAADGTYFVLIYGYEGAENSYDMVVEVPSAGPTATPTSTPTLTPTRTSTPTPSPTGGPTSTPTSTPTLTPTGRPTETRTPTPTATPTGGPTSTPTSTPTLTPTGRPTETRTPTPTATPTPTPTAPPGELCEDLLVNGSFESGLSPWQWQTNAGPGSPVTSDWASEGIYSARLGDGNDRADLLQQDVVVPGDVVTLTLTYDLNVEGAGDAEDWIYAEVVDSDGMTVVNWHDGSQTGQSSQTVDLTGWQAPVKGLGFEAQTNGHDVSRFYVDNVRLVACGPPGTPVPSGKIYMPVMLKISRP